MIKTIFKWLGFLLLIIVLLGGSFAAYEWNADKPFRFRSFVDREVFTVHPGCDERPCSSHVV